MDISSRQFPNEMVSIIQRIASSHFVALDLEFSGIHSNRNRGRAQKLTLQEVYEQTKEAAKQYQVLQVGLTVVEEDVERGVYIAMPYNFHINPIPAKEEYHGLERRWSFQSGAVAFLLKNKFYFDRIFSEGIQYLSRQEEAQIRESWAMRDAQRAAIEDMELKAEDTPLVDHIRSSVRDWLSQSLAEKGDYLNIPHIPQKSLATYGVPDTLSRYQIRLTHQIVRNYFPDLKTIGRVGFVRITFRNGKEDMEEKLRQNKYREQDVIHAIEFRWLIEALCGGDISNIPQRYLLAGLQMETGFHKDGVHITKLAHTLQLKLKNRRRILFGHNCFIDLVYLFAAFIGDLPEKVEDFQELIHALFPAVIDTKYMASLTKDFRFKSDLETVEKELRNEELPLIETPRAFDKYVGVERGHEAGYDSFMTTNIAIKLATKIARERRVAKPTRPQLIIKAGETIIVDPSNVDDDEDDATDEYVTPTESVAASGSFVDTLTSKLSAAFMPSENRPLQTSFPISSMEAKDTFPVKKVGTLSDTINDKNKDLLLYESTDINTFQTNDRPLKFPESKVWNTVSNNTTAGYVDEKRVPSQIPPKMEKTKESLAHNNRYNVLDSLPGDTVNVADSVTTPSTRDRTKKNKNKNKKGNDNDLLLLSSPEDTEDTNTKQKQRQQHFDHDQPVSSNKGTSNNNSNASGDSDDLWPPPPEATPLTAEALAKKAKRMAARGELMPRWDDQDGFWQVVGNRLVVTASQEGVCLL